jgi:hypothetical protein
VTTGFYNGVMMNILLSMELDTFYNALCHTLICGFFLHRIVIVPLRQGFVTVTITPL